MVQGQYPDSIEQIAQGKHLQDLLYSWFLPLYAGDIPLALRMREIINNSSRLRSSIHGGQEVASYIRKVSKVSSMTNYLSDPTPTHAVAVFSDPLILTSATSTTWMVRNVYPSSKYEIMKGDHCDGILDVDVSCKWFVVFKSSYWYDHTSLNEDLWLLSPWLVKGSEYDQQMNPPCCYRWLELHVPRVFWSHLFLLYIALEVHEKLFRAASIDHHDQVAKFKIVNGRSYFQSHVYHGVSAYQGYGGLAKH